MSLLKFILIGLVIICSCQSESPKEETIYKDTGILKHKKIYEQCGGTSYRNGVDKEYTAIAQNDNVLIRDESDMGKIIGTLKLGEKVKVIGWDYATGTNGALISRDTLIWRGGENYFPDSSFLLQKGKYVLIDWIDTIDNSCHVFFQTNNLNGIALIHKDYLRLVPDHAWFVIRTKNNVVGLVYNEFLRFIPKYPLDAFY